MDGPQYIVVMGSWSEKTGTVVLTSSAMISSFVVASGKIVVVGSKGIEVVVTLTASSISINN